MKILRIQHIAVASKNMIRDSRVFEALFGLDMNHTEKFPSEGHQVAMMPVGETNIEFVEAIRPDHDINRFIELKGEGIFHICFEVDNLDEAMEELRQKNVTFYFSPKIGVHGSRYTFLQIQHTANVLVEIAEMPKTMDKAG